MIHRKPVLIGLASALALALTMNASLAQTVEPHAHAQQQFQKQLKELKTDLTALDEQIKKKVANINNHLSGDAALKEIDALRERVSDLLQQAANNGPISMLGQEALRNARNRLRNERQDTTLTADERQRLLKDGTRVVAETEASVKALERARMKFLSLLKKLQNKEHYIGELMAWHDQEAVAKAIKDLADTLNKASVTIEKVISIIEAPKPET